jgi:hypothetical protein
MANEASLLLTTNDDQPETDRDFYRQAEKASSEA